MADEKKRVKRRDKKNISNGVAHVNSTFNNTMITISDGKRGCDFLVISRLNGV